MTDDSHPHATSPDTPAVPSTNSSLRWRDLGGLLFAVVAIAISARISIPIPLSPVPVTGQTLAVLLVGAVLGKHSGPLAVGLYLMAGLAGLPIFANGAAGLERLTGPTGGYLVGFVVGAWFAGWATERESSRRFGWPSFSRLLIAMLVAHGAILVLGGGRLAMFLDPQAAWARGIAPFLAGAFLKSILATTVVLWLRARRHQH